MSYSLTDVTIGDSELSSISCPVRICSSDTMTHSLMQTLSQSADSDLECLCIQCLTSTLLTPQGSTALKFSFDALVQSKVQSALAPPSLSSAMPAYTRALEEQAVTDLMIVRGRWELLSHKHCCFMGWSILVTTTQEVWDE